MGNIINVFRQPNVDDEDYDCDSFVEIQTEDVLSSQTENNETGISLDGSCNSDGSIKSNLTRSKVSVAEKLIAADEECRKIINAWNDQQLTLKTQLILKEDYEFVSNLRYVGGVDISFPADKNDLVHACACFVVLSYPDLKIVYKKCKIVHLTSIYVPEYLAFREVEPMQKLCREVMVDKPELYPQLILVDGNGLLHPRLFGLACHLGIVLKTPTVGVAKKLFHVDGLEKDQMFRSKVQNLNEKGSSFELIGKSGQIFGRALKSTAKSSNPIYVSIGHKISLEMAVELITKMCAVRVPEPVRWADILSREFIRENYKTHINDCCSYIDLNKRFLALSQLTSS